MKRKQSQKQLGLLWFFPKERKYFQMCLSQLKSDLFKIMVALRADQMCKQQCSLPLKGSWALYVLPNVLFLRCSQTLSEALRLLPEQALLWIPLCTSSWLCLLREPLRYARFLLLQARSSQCQTRVRLLRSRTALFLTVHPGEVRCPSLAP